MKRGQVFAAMQTGNVIFLGLGIAGGAGAPFAAPLVALLAFLAGGLAAALLARRIGLGAALTLGPALGIEVGLLATAALLVAVIEVEPGAASAYATIALLAIAMGLRNTVVRGLGGPNLATTVLNLTVTALSAGAPLGLATGADISVRAAAFVALLTGAVSGALLVEASLVLPIALAAAITLVVGLQLRSQPK